jgi:hypothetical protein
MKYKYQFASDYFRDVNDDFERPNVLSFSFLGSDYAYRLSQNGAGTAHSLTFMRRDTGEYLGLIVFHNPKTSYADARQFLRESDERIRAGLFDPRTIETAPPRNWKADIERMAKKMGVSDEAHETDPDAADADFVFFFLSGADGVQHFRARRKNDPRKNLDFSVRNRMPKGPVSNEDALLTLPLIDAFNAWRRELHLRTIERLRGRPEVFGPIDDDAEDGIAYAMAILTPPKRVVGRHWVPAHWELVV